MYSNNPKMAWAVVLACLFGTLVLPASSFYLPGVAPQDYLKVCWATSASVAVDQPCAPHSLH